MKVKLDFRVQQNVLETEKQTSQQQNRELWARVVSLFDTFGLRIA